MACDLQTVIFTIILLFTITSKLEGVTMEDCYSSVCVWDYIDCFRHDFDLFKFNLEQEEQKFDDEIFTSMQFKYIEGSGVFFYLEGYFDEDELTTGFCNALGVLLESAGMAFLEFSFSQTAPRMLIGGHDGGSFRIYSDGRLVWPKLQ